MTPAIFNEFQAGLSFAWTLVFGFLSVFAALGWAYETGRRDGVRHCQHILNESHLATALQMASLKEQLRPWIGDRRARA
jgi:hypothetical protein